MKTKKNKLKAQQEQPYRRFNSIDDAKEFLNYNNIPLMTGEEMLKKMSEAQIIKFAEFLFYM